MSNIKIKDWGGRLGNNIIQFCNALFIAFFHNYNLQIPNHKFFKKHFIIINDDSVDQTHITKYCKIEKYIFLKYIEIDMNNIFKENQKEVLQCLKDNFIINVPFKQNNDLVIHIRSGDKFFNGEFKNSDNLFPPLYYYETILNNNKFDNVSIICEDNRSPIVKELCNKYKYINFKLQSLELDIMLLLSAKNIVFSMGTFLNVLIYSNNVKNIFFPKYNLCDTFLNCKVFTPIQGYEFNYDIYALNKFDIPVNKHFIELLDYPQKMYHSKHKVECLLHYKPDGV